MSTATEQAAVGHYLGKGLSKDVAVGIVSVLMVESGLNPGAENNSGSDKGGVLNEHGAYGVAQWNGGRQQSLANFATAKGLNPTDLNTQLDFVLTESANSYPQVWAAMRQSGIDYQDFIPIFVRGYENPADPTAEINKALSYAADLYQAPIVAPAPAPAQPSTPTTGATPAMNPELIAMLAPLFEALFSALIKGLVTQAGPAQAQTSGTPAPANIDPTSLINPLLSALLPQIESIVAAQLAKALPKAS